MNEKAEGMRERGERREIGGKERKEREKEEGEGRDKEEEN